MNKKKKLIIISIIVFVTGLLIGVGLIIIGSIKSINYKNNIKNNSVVTEKFNSLKERFKGIDSFSDKYEEFEDELNDLQDDLGIGNLNELLDDFGFDNILIKPRMSFGKLKYLPYYVVGSIIIFSFSIVSIVLFVAGKRSEDS